MFMSSTNNKYNNNVLTHQQQQQQQAIGSNRLYQQQQQPVQSLQSAPISQQAKQQTKPSNEDESEPVITESDWDNIPLKVIDNETKSIYTRGKLLGKGGFARCYLFHDEQNDIDVAGKVVLKKTLVKERTKRKLITEIKIHATLKHSNVVQFTKFFEDSNCVYMMMELCESKSMMELMKTRKRLTEPEVQYYLKQIVDGVIYLHRSLVIHRDLKLGNLFLTKDLQVKIGDFGLATRLDRRDERKVTICGTPNYLAPEILDGAKAGGHSFEVDIWSIGVIFFTLLTGKPPFETSSVKTTYKKIRETSYDFPPNLAISDAAKSLIKNILTRRPECRPTLDQIASHEFFKYPTPPISLPISSLEIPPDAASLVVVAPSMKPPQQQFDSNGYPQPLSAKKLQGKENTNIGDINTNASHGKTSSTTPMAAPAPVCVNHKNETLSEREELKLLHDHIQSRIPECLSEKKGFIPSSIPKQDEKPAQYYLTKWVDYTSKYGMGYVLSDGSVGVYFNDATKILLYPNGTEFDYYDRHNVLYVSNGSSLPSTTSSTTAMASAMAATGIISVNNLPKRQTLTKYDSFLDKKVLLLKHFRDYLSRHESQSANVVSDKDFGQSLFTEGNENTIKNVLLVSSDVQIPFVRKWLKTKHAHFYRLSDGTVQVKFHDRSELVLSSSRILTFVDRKSIREDIRLDIVNVEERHDIGKRLRYLKDILHLLVEQYSSSSTPQAPMSQVQQKVQQKDQRQQHQTDNIKEPRADPFSIA